ncbi:hypothetical protein [Plantactinospora sp. CA-290183]|uniref:hypothetical protein n=1 Tax=Plantactinospora sp. CA-290183 TaxID=3240006 RepID=UPI003D8A811B
MRRLLVTAAIAAALFSTVGCSGERDGAAGTASPGAGPSAGATASGSPSPGGSAPGAPAGETAPAGGNAKEVCAAATRSSSESVRTFVEELGKSLQAAGANDTRGAQEAQRKAEAALSAWGATMREQSSRATDERLKTVLAEIATEVGTMKASVESVDENKLDQLQQRLDQLCGS